MQFFVISLWRQVQVLTDVCTTFDVVNKAGPKFYWLDDYLLMEMICGVFYRLMAILSCGYI